MDKKTGIIIGLIFLASAGVSYYVWFVPSLPQLPILGFLPGRSRSPGDASPQSFADLVEGETSPSAADNAVIQRISVSRQLVGEISAIEGRTLTLTKDGDRLAVTVEEGVSVIKMTAPSAPPPAPLEEGEMAEPPMPEDIRFEDLKVGDQVSVILQGESFGTLQVTGVMLLEE